LESINIKLTTGVGYNINQDNDSGTITIVSKEQDTTTLDPSDLTANVFSATCPGVNEGKIAMANESPFNFSAELYRKSGELVDTADLIGDIRTPLVLFQNLEAGEYTIKLKIADRNDILPPSFNLTVRDNLSATQLIASYVKTEDRMASLTVSGSNFYKVLVNKTTYEYYFTDNGLNELQVPLEWGNNTLLINGQSSCQGTIESKLLLSDYKVFPNPTNAVVNFTGLPNKSNLKLIFYDTTGKIVAVFKRTNINTSNWEINVEALSKGTYIGKLVANEQEIFDIKLIKN
jgi:hypothetical protein